MTTPRTGLAGRPSRLTAGCIALGGALAALLAVVGCYAFNRVVLGDGLGHALPDLVVRIASALFGTVAAALAVAFAFRIFDGPMPPEPREPPPAGPSQEKTFPGPHELGKGRLNEHDTALARGKE
jgi:hypothetical protein